MSAWLEIILPVRNPGSKFLETADSLVQQTERDFGVVLSDNFSQEGFEHLVAAEHRLKAGGISVRRIKPLWELGRVQHWNWAHAQAQATWLKPLFVGDILFPHYVERLHARVEKRPDSALVRCEFQTRRPGTTATTSVPFEEQSLTPQQFLAWFPSHGNWLGGPINMAYRKSAWRAAGGYAVHMPACADLNLYVNLTLHHGLETIPETLAAFQLHEQRFSHGIGKRRVNGCFELWLILRQARNYCSNVGLIWPERGVARGVARQMKVDYWEPARQRLKQLWSKTQGA
jgi:hypothetical protein